MEGRWWPGRCSSRGRCLPATAAAAGPARRRWRTGVAALEPGEVCWIRVEPHGTRRANITNRRRFCRRNLQSLRSRFYTHDNANMTGNSHRVTRTKFGGAGDPDKASPPAAGAGEHTGACIGDIQLLGTCAAWHCGHYLVERLRDKPRAIDADTITNQPVTQVGRVGMGSVISGRDQALIQRLLQNRSNILGGGFPHQRTAAPTYITCLDCAWAWRRAPCSAVSLPGFGWGWLWILICGTFVRLRWHFRRRAADLPEQSSQCTALDVRCPNAVVRRCASFSRLMKYGGCTATDSLRVSPASCQLTVTGMFENRSRNCSSCVSIKVVRSATACCAWGCAPVGFVAPLDAHPCR